LPYNCTRILKGWNILPLIESLSVRSSSVALRSYREGNILFKRTVPSPPPQGTPHLLIHRAEFLKVLFHEALKLGVVVRFDSIITGIDFTKPSLEVSGTGEVLYDVIFGADGQKSYCREIFLGRLDPPRFSKDLAYRIVIPLSECEGNEELSELLGNFDINCWMGPNAHVVCYQLKGALNIVMVGPDSHSAWADGWQVDLQEVDTVFEGWDPRLRMLRQLSKGVLRRHLLSSHEMDTWSHANGTFALLGDACHVATPHL
jgi:salicylate hydroxylase